MNYIDHEGRRIDEKVLNFILNVIPGLLCIDNNGTITYVNGQMEQYRGYSYDDMVEKNIREFFPYTKMMESLDMKEDERIILYQGEGIASQVLCEASFHKLIKDDNQVLGLMTYDLFQNIPELERFLGMYINLDEKVKYAKHDLKNTIQPSIP